MSQPAENRLVKKIACMVIFMIGVAMFAGVANAYEVETHGYLTHQAYLASSLVTDSTLPDLLGIETIKDDLGDVYLDMVVNPSAFEVRERNSTAYSVNIIEGSLGLGGELTAVAGWMMRGAIREDDLKEHPVLSSVCLEVRNPTDDDYDPAVDRPFNHFYDPVSNQGLSVPATTTYRSPDWGIGFTDAFAASPAVMADRRNHYSILDAREAMYRALSGHATADDGMSPDLDIIPTGFSGSMDELRRSYWATTFRALGNVVHLVEDMGQPQHTRNDMHGGECIYYFSGDPSVYERYINGRILQDERIEFDISNVGPTGATTSYSPITLSQYSKPSFNRYSDYWSTREGMAGRGLGDFSNREFFSAGTNFGDNVYSSPSNTRSDYQIVPTWPTDKAGIVNYLAAPVNDFQESGQTLTGLKTRESILDDSLTAYLQRDYSLDKTVYDTQAAFLLPRAVAYSAGLIDYFFRGRLAISLPPEGIYGIIDQNAPHALINNVTEKGLSGGGGVFGFEKIILNVSNATPAIDDGQAQAPYPQDIGAGTFRAVAHYRLNSCYTPDLSGEGRDIATGTLNCDSNVVLDPQSAVYIATSEAVAVNSFNNQGTNRLEFDFSADPIPANAVDLKMQVVFYGELGTEKQSIAVGMNDISEPSFYAIRNSSDYYSLNQVVYRTDDQAFIDAANAEGIPPYAYAAYTTSNGTLTIGNTAGVVSAPALQVGEFTRMAYLADYSPVTVTIYISPISGYTHIINPRRVNIDSSGSRIFLVMGSVGGDPNRLYGNSIVFMSFAAYPDPNLYGDISLVDNFPVPLSKTVTVCFPSCP